MSSTLSSQVTLFDTGAAVAFAAFLRGTLALALDDGTALLVNETGGQHRVAAHPGGTVLSAAAAGERLITGGDDGRIVAISAEGAVQEIADENGKWIDALAARKDGTTAWSCGKLVRARDAQGNAKALAVPSSVRGLAFLPKGYRLAIAHYGGVSLWFPNTAAEPERLEWKGSHLSVTVSPDGRFLATTMQENALHAWRIADKADFRMTGYPAKTRSLSWSHDSRFLATSGADAAVIWSFTDKEGPGGKSPLECGTRQAKVTSVAFHPKAPVVAQGYEDGAVLLCRIPDGAEILVRATPKPAGAVTALTWDSTGGKLLFGAADGLAGLLVMPG